MSYLRVGQWLPIVSYKHNGKIHRTWDRVMVLSHDEHVLVVANDHSTVTESDGRTWSAREPAISFFFPNQFFNIICMCRETGIHYYCNLASPFYANEEAIFYIDYDLDVALSPMSNIRILDEAEYARHRVLMGYSSELDVALRTALHQLIDKMKMRQFPFDDQQVKNFLQQYMQLV